MPFYGFVCCFIKTTSFSPASLTSVVSLHRHGYREGIVEVAIFNAFAKILQNSYKATLPLIQQTKKGLRMLCA
jgi:hypothetical protein